MTEHWTATADALPGENQYVYFLLDHHEVPIAGVYTLGGFRTRWADYDGGRVKCWCPAMIEDEGSEVSSAA